jgi:uncharacterized protein YdgA (DUF945 family)
MKLRSLTAIKQEEDLASVNRCVAEVDKWEGAHFTEDKIRNEVKAAKKKYEDALLRKALWLLNKNNGTRVQYYPPSMSASGTPAQIFSHLASR